MNVFRKCLRKEFGKNRYGLYVLMCREELKKAQPITDSQEQAVQIEKRAVYQDMYNRLSRAGREELDSKTESLTEALIRAFEIGRQYWFVLAFYAMASLLMIGLQLQTAVTVVSLILMGICFLYKTYECFSNKFCFIDAYLLMVYKSVLEKLVETTQ